MEHDGHGYVVNGKATYQAINDIWCAGRPVTINWSPGNGSAHVVLLSPAPRNPGGDWAHSIHPATHASSIMFISIVRIGCFGFDMLDGQWTHEDYAGEKLNLRGSDATAMAELINGMKSAVSGKRVEAPGPEAATPESADFAVRPPTD